ncbi:MAG: class I SAM-dependent methyltransferase [Bacteroidota bacterium]
MNRNNLLIQLKKTIESHQGIIRNLQKEESEDEFDSIIYSALEGFNKIVLTNISQIIKNFLFVKKIEVEKLIEHLRNSCNNQFDLLTVEREIEDGFDNKFGTITGVIKEQYLLNEIISLERFENSARYHPTPVKSMRLALHSLKQDNVNYSKSIFIDVGSGMGRNLLIASEYQFQEIIGIEISKELHKIAKKNIVVYENENQKCKNINTYCMDILDFAIPTYECIVLYFWEPFGQVVFNKFYQKILESICTEKQKIVLVFLGNVFSIVKESKEFSLIKTIETPDKVSEKDFFSLSYFSN